MTTKERNKQLDAIDQAIIHTRRFYLTTISGTDVAGYADVALESLTKALQALRYAQIEEPRS